MRNEWVRRLILCFLHFIFLNLTTCCCHRTEKKSIALLERKIALWPDLTDRQRKSPCFPFTLSCEVDSLTLPPASTIPLAFILLFAITSSPHFVHFVPPLHLTLLHIAIANQSSSHFLLLLITLLFSSALYTRPSHRDVICRRRIKHGRPVGIYPIVTVSTRKTLILATEIENCNNTNNNNGNKKKDRTTNTHNNNKDIYNTISK
ncbi:hypothetical protein BKA57DRAFT_319435 [Linnemannia elongata]|nr:hypothetical protein BKA57DRAFT_319435 [Linnemannia elongata]